MAIMREVADYSGKFFSDYWIRKNILRQTDQDIAEIDEQIQQEKAEEMAQVQAQEQQSAGGVPVQGSQGTPSSPDQGQSVSPSPQNFISSKGVDYDASSLI
jgi:hypothetical protein